MTTVKTSENEKSEIKHKQGQLKYSGIKRLSYRRIQNTLQIAQYSLTGLCRMSGIEEENHNALLFVKF